METEDWIFLSLAIGVPLLFIAAGFVVGCFERQCVRMFRDAPLAALPPYLAATMRDAAALGFVGMAGGVHTKFGDKVVGVLCLSGDGLVLAMIGEGTILGMPSKRTTLFSRARSGRA